MNISRMRTTKRLPISLSKIIFILLAMFFSSFAAHATDLDLEKDLQGKLEQSKRMVETARVKQKSGTSTIQEAKRLRALGENVAASDMLFKERIKVRDQKVKGLNSKAVDRHQSAAEGYTKALKEYLDLVNAIPANGSIPNKTLNKLETLLEKIVHKKTRPIIGSLPYKHLGYAAKEPSTSPSVTPAYRGGNTTVNSADTQATAEAPISPEIAALAQSLNWNPVLIYEYVKNNIETEWYFGCMKGAEDTLHQKSGNDCDQATLLVALMRASGYPTRYVRGTVEFFPDIEKAKNLTGVSDPAKLGEFFQKAGIPFKTVLDGITIKNIQIEHIWVETFVPYSNYRGAVMDDQGKVWLGLDTSIKASGYTYNTSADIASEYGLSTFRDDYLAAVRTQTPLEYLKAKINDYLVLSHPSTTYSDYLATKTLVPEVMQILPAGMQFKEIKITNEYSAIPDDLLHKVIFAAKDTGNAELFTVTFDAFSLINRKVIINHEPETVEDQEIVDSFGGISNTPAYLVHLRPVLLIDDERIVLGNSGVAMGSDYTFAVTVSSPNSAETLTNSMISGNMAALGIVGQKASIPAGSDEEDAADLLHREALRYIDNWNKAEDELASLLHVSTARPIPTVVTLGNSIDVTYVLDQPQGFTWKGLFLDADLRAIEVVRSQELGVGSEREKLLMQLSGLQGSVLESKLFEDAFGVESISTAKLFGSANSSQPVVPIISIDQANIATVLSALSFDQNIKDDITDSVNNQNLTVRIPQSEIAFQDWTGIGYIKEKSSTGEAGYMLSGMVAGGMTALGVLRWPEPWVTVLQGYENLYTGPTNTNPASADTMDKVLVTDYQGGQVVNTETTQPLTVMVQDSNRLPVANASVTFTVKAGGGFLRNATTNELVTTLTITTDSAGRAKAHLKLGKYTSTNPNYVQRSWETYPWQVGENIVDATLGSGPNTGTSLTEPFTILAFPDTATTMNVTGGNGISDVLSFYGTLATFVTDTYSNPISNMTVTYTSQAPQTGGAPYNCAPGANTKWAQLFSDKTCANDLVSWGECAGAAYTITGTTYVDGSFNVGVVLGDAPAVAYPITIVSVLSGGQTTKTAKLYTTSYSTSQPCTLGQDVLGLNRANQTDSQGNNIEARPANVPSAIWAKAYVLSPVNGLPAVTYPPEMAVTFSAQNTNTSVVTTYTGTNTGNGKFQAQVSLSAAPYDVTINATYGSAAPATLTTRIYGVELQTPNYLVMPIDADGYAMLDTALTYTIAPSAYRAATAQIALYKNDSIIAVMQTEKQGAGFGTISQGFKFDKNSNYYYRVVLNYEYGDSEIWSAKMPLTVASLYIEKQDPAFPDVKLKWDDYYPALGNKTITLQSVASLNGSTVTCEVVEPITVPDQMTVPTCAATNGQIVNGTVKFNLTGTDLLPPVNNDSTTGINDIKLRFTIPQNASIPAVEATFHVKNNSNVTFQDVLNGEAVFTADKDSVISTSTGNTTATQGFDYVQELLNQVVPRIRQTYDDTTQQWVSNQYALLQVNGVYSDASYIGVKQYKRSFGLSAEASDTYNKIKKDYGLSATDANNWTWFDKIIEKEALVGKTQRIPADSEIISTTNADTMLNSDPANTTGDTGLYELYKNVVQRFVNKMIEEGDRYRQSTGSGSNTSWVSRPTGTGVSVTNTESESYCFGCKNTYTQFWSAVTQCPPPAQGQVSSTYAGNVNESGCGLTGTKKYPGLYQVELNTAQQYYAFDYWTGIDCAGFVQRMAMAGKSVAVPGVMCSIPDLTDRDINPINHLDDDGILAQAFFTDTSIVSYWENPDTTVNQAILQRKLKKGDLVRYGNTHISMIYSDAQTCEANTCTYEIVHASGDRNVCYGRGRGQKDDCSFNRKVVRNLINDRLRSETLKNPTGFGRIKLWD